jgi:hypothetical protein
VRLIQVIVQGLDEGLDEAFGEELEARRRSL